MIILPLNSNAHLSTMKVLKFGTFYIYQEIHQTKRYIVIKYLIGFAYLQFRKFSTYHHSYIYSAKDFT